MTLMTLIWGFGLVLQTMVACVLVFKMSIARYLLVSPFVGYGMMGGLMLWTFWYANRAKKRGMAARAAAASGETPVHTAP